MSHRETAEKIVERYVGNHLAMPGPVDAIEQALIEASRVPEGFVRDDKGVDRKVLGGASKLTGALRLPCGRRCVQGA